ncbi:MAG: Uma2 family endonuclease [Lachnospiraceae bacterium]|nr:Uma2 family endonuclease [Lachnospiraceae bacterium]
MRIEEMREQKRQLGLTNEQIAELSGVPLGTVQKVFGGITKSPRYDTLLALEKVLAGEDAGKGPEELRPAFVEESSGYTVEGSSAKSTGKKQGEYTVEDYLRLPDDRRYELINGDLYVMEAPSSGHQMMGGMIYRELTNYILEKGRECTPFISPLDVQLNNDNKTMVQPDVIVVCDRSKMKGGKCHGAPDLVVEVLSPSTMWKDMSLKYDIYFHAGVREYWMIDLKGKRILVYLMDESESVCRIYGMEDQVPVSIFDGGCVIDFRKIWEHTAWLEE